jgi:hypothetical protein
LDRLPVEWLRRLDRPPWELLRMREKRRPVEEKKQRPVGRGWPLEGRPLQQSGAIWLPLQMES